MLIRAFKIAYKAHKSQKDKGGKAYIFHPLHVAFNVRGKNEKVVALLHDVVEDTSIAFSDLKDMGISDVCVEALMAITKRHGEDYEIYLKRVKSNDIARRVKIADISHNMDLNRLKDITDKDMKRVEKYKTAKMYLATL